MDKSVDENAKSESQDNDQEITTNKSDFDYRIPFKKNTITEKKVYKINPKDSNNNSQRSLENDKNIAKGSFNLKNNMPTSKLKIQPQTNSANIRNSFKKSIFDIVT